MAKKRQAAKLHDNTEAYTTVAGVASEVKPDAVLTRPPEQEAVEPEPAVELPLATVIVELPLGEVGEKEYLSRHVESRLKSLKQRVAMKRLLHGLRRAGATTEDGRPVQRPGEVVRWVLEQISDSD